MTSKLARVAVALLALELGVHCTSFDPGAELTVGLMHHEGAGRAPRPDGQPRVVTTDLAFTVTLTHAAVAVDQIEILPCTPPRASRWPSLVSVAHAHGAATSPTILHVDHVIDLLIGDLTVRPIGLLLPPPGAYCGALVRIAPIDGTSIRLQGTYAAPGRQASPFTVELALEGEAGIVFDGVDGRPRVLELSPEGPAEIAVGIDYALWFDGIDFETHTADEIEAAVLRNVLLSLHHHDPQALR